jgi:hypothetical protein
MRNFEEKMGCTFMIIWAVFALGVVGFWTFIVWAIYRLVMHFTG